jgi:methionyl-tRNA formyltransferase
MKIIFFGTPDYVVPIVDTLYKTFKKQAEGSPIITLVTQKPKPVGRKKQLEYSAVDKWAYSKDSNVKTQNSKIKIYYSPNELIKNKVSADIGILAAYGEIIPEKVIKHFPHGILNIHPSLLPKYRGASPVQATLVSGDKETGVTIIKLDDELDHGPIVSQFKEKVQVQDNTDTLRNRLFEKSTDVLTTLLPAYLSGKITLKEQDHKKATFTRLIKKSDGFIPPKYLNTTLKGESLKGHKDRWKIPFVKNYYLVPSIYSLERFIRAMQPWPVSWTYVQLSDKRKMKSKKRLKILKSHLEPKGNMRLVLDLVQLEGKNPVSWEQFKQGYPNATFE